jgi:hypothetical protein
MINAVCATLLRRWIMRWQAVLFPAGLLFMAGCGDAGDDPAAIVGPIVIEVIVSPSEVRVPVGATVQLAARLLDSDGKELLNGNVYWRSSDRDVASVLAGGLVTGVRPGTAKLSASSRGVSDTAFVIVEPSGVVAVIHGLAWTIEVGGGGPAPFSGVWGSSETDVFAVGNNGPRDECCGTIMHYDGSAWRYMTFPNSNEALYDVWGSSRSDVFAVGGSFLVNSRILHYDGTKWTSMTSGATDFLEAVWGSSADDVFAVGMWNVIMHYDGKTWSEMPNPGDLDSWSLVDVWGSSGSDVFAVGQYGTIMHYNGTSWSRMRSPTAQNLSGVWGSSAISVFAVGDGGSILHYDGTAWSQMSSPTSHDLLAVRGNSGSDVFAVGDGAMILHYDGASWSAVAGPTGHQLFDLWGSPAHTFVVGSGPVVLHATR